MVWESLGVFCQTPSRLSCAFYWGVASVWPLYHKRLIGGVLQTWLSFLKVLPSPQRNSLLSLARWPVLLLPKFFHLRLMEATVFLGTFNAAETFWYPYPDLCLDTIISRFSADNSFRPYGLVFSSSCTVNCGTLYRPACAFPSHVQSIEFTTGGLQSSWRHISRMINGNRMHLRYILSLIAKGKNSYVNKVFMFIFNAFEKCLKTCFHFAIIGYCV